MRLAPESAARFARQLLLPGMGEEGQLRLMASSAPVDGDGLAHEVARRYAERAGASVEPGAIDVAGRAPERVVDRAAPRAVLAGSRAALAVMRAAVEEAG